MAITIATFHARNDDGNSTVIKVVRVFKGFEEIYQEKFIYCAQSDDIGISHSYKKNEPEKIAAELARRSGYHLHTDAGGLK
jgi:hypothetical protein